MIITLCGKDIYRRNQKLKAILAEYRAKRNVYAIESFDLEKEGDERCFYEFLKTPSLFTPVKLVTLKNLIALEKTKDLKKTLKEAADDSTNTIIISESAILAEFRFLLEAPCQKQEFEELTGEKFIFFLKKEAEARGVALQPDALRFLADVFAGETWGAVCELEKLSLLNDKKSVTLQILKELGLRVSLNFFNSIQGWFRKSLRERLLGLETLFANKEDAAKIFNILAYSDPQRLRLFADYDIEVKSGKLEYDDVLLDLAIH